MIPTLLLLIGAVAAATAARAPMLPKSSNMKSRVCLKTSLYRYDPNECGDLGECYKYYCYDKTYRCSHCLPPPCLDDGEAVNNTAASVSSFDTEASDKALVSVRTAGVVCMGFLARVTYTNADGEPVDGNVVVTSANCVTTFDVQCHGGAGGDTKCLMSDEGRITGVFKGFRAYLATVEYEGWCFFSVARQCLAVSVEKTVTVFQRTPGHKWERSFTKPYFETWSLTELVF